ncbi:MAG: PhzF family phenazine biosynthesis isomerase [Bacteroidetes bacterium]|nr:PhzF family phenazine biosynthesis isomerase [Bacteroidota bacterium]
MTLPIFQGDAFTDEVFSGNPAAVVPLDKWLPDAVLQSIAAENNLAETAFFVASKDAADFELRWFTPTVEIDLCGHATLASAFVLFTQLEWQRPVIHFSSQSGSLSVKQSAGGYTLDFPARVAQPVALPDGLEAALGQPVKSFSKAVAFMAVLEDEAAVRAVTPDFDYISKLDGDGLIVTAPGDHSDCVSRYFAPACGIDEDPVTGGAHCTLAPYWAGQLSKTGLHARQASARGGEMFVEVDGDRVKMTGKAVLFMNGFIINY